MSVLQVGGSFVLNCLGEDDADATMKHFLKRFGAGADRFQVGRTEGIKLRISFWCFEVCICGFVVQCRGCGPDFDWVIRAWAEGLP